MTEVDELEEVERSKKVTIKAKCMLQNSPQLGLFK